MKKKEVLYFSKKIEFLLNYSFEEVAIKQSQSLREISSKHVDKSLTPFKDYLKETRNIKLNNPIKAKVKLCIIYINLSSSYVEIK